MASPVPERTVKNGSADTGVFDDLVYQLAGHHPGFELNAIEEAVWQKTTGDFGGLAGLFDLLFPGTGHDFEGVRVAPVQIRLSHPFA